MKSFLIQNFEYNDFFIDNLITNNFCQEKKKKEIPRVISNGCSSQTF